MVRVHVSVALKRAVVGDWRFDNLCESQGGQMQPLEVVPPSQKKPKRTFPFDLPTEISGIFGVMESTLNFHPVSGSWLR